MVLLPMLLSHELIIVAHGLSCLQWQLQQIVLDLKDEAIATDTTCRY